MIHDSLLSYVLSIPLLYKSLVQTSLNLVLLSTPSPELRTRTIQSSGWTEPELNRTISSVLLVLVLVSVLN